MTGVTAVVAPSSALGAVDVRGAAPGTRETDALASTSSGERVHAVLLVGRSVFGLAAADGATVELEARGIGLPIEATEVGRITIPIVAAAVVFDFGAGDPSARPGPIDGRRAVAAALDDPMGRPAGGPSGAGVGAMVGGIVAPRRSGGLGHASLIVEIGGRELVAAALVVVNSAGSPFRADGSPWATRGGFDEPGPVPDFSRITSARGNTTLAVIGTNARLSKAQLGQVATMAHDGLARAIRPIHTGVDGDVVFALSTADRGDEDGVVAHDWGPAAVSIVGALAADAATRAVLDAIGERG